VPESVAVMPAVVSAPSRLALRLTEAGTAQQLEAAIHLLAGEPCLIDERRPLACRQLVRSPTAEVVRDSLCRLQSREDFCIDFG
jgi:hypothetical protein